MLQRYLIFLIPLILLIANHQLSIAQDIEKIVKADPVKVSGGLGIDNVFYHADGISDRRNAPYQYFLTGNINFLFFGEFSVPVSLSYSNQKFNYTQPLNQQQFNRFGISPKYRWITGHIGWRNMTFSPYSLNGHTFLGGGVELSPGKFRVGAMYGRLLNAVEYDSLSNSSNKPAYERMGMGLNVRYEDKGNAYGISLFRSQDNVSSLSGSLDSIGVTPEENLVLDISVKENLSPKITVDAEFANSTITRDSRVQDEVKNNAVGIIDRNVTTVNYTAYKGNIYLQLKKAKIGAGYERIAPGYRTHGAYFFNNDLENITINYARPLFKNKVNLALNAGTQRNNLDTAKISTMRRWVGSLNLGWQASEKLNCSFNYSNFQTFTNMRSQFQVINSSNPYQYIDTLNYVQVSQSVNINASYIISSNEKRQQNLSFTGSAQKANEEQGGKELPTGSTFYNANLAWVYTFVPSGLAFNLAGNGMWNEMLNANSTILGPTLGVSKGFFDKKMTTVLSWSWNTTLLNGASSGSVGSVRLSNNVIIKKKHSVVMSLIWLNRASKQNSIASSFNEYTARIGYNFRF